ncbi:hypothetical protein [Bradyrhizobium sp. NFR13]|uniref:hypothetical protein n=1 Tax=Bradyrhizobium sp. NFR13 TaxID=1566285 RepID=UPI000B831EEC|nr:hypothetical protein [Bradyrhizobium sp. NFR13]
MKVAEKLVDGHDVELCNLLARLQCSSTNPSPVSKPNVSSAVNGAPGWRCGVPDDCDKNELYRRLAQARRLIAGPLDPLTLQRLEALAVELEKQLTVVELNDTDAPEA